MDGGHKETFSPQTGPRTLPFRLVRFLAGQRIRLVATVGMSSCLIVLGIAAWLTPSPDGFGTHRQLGYPACLSPLLTGYPCPTCGMTTSFAYAVRGRWLRAFHAQPAGFALFMATVAACVCFARIASVNRADVLRIRFHTGRVAMAGVAIVVLGWVYKLLTFPV